MRRFLFVQLLVIILLALGGCGGGGGTNILPLPQPDKQDQTTGKWDKSAWDNCTWGE